MSGGNLRQVGESLRVSCYAGHRGDERPRRFLRSGRWIEVETVEDAWTEPAHRCFRVRGDDGASYLLRHERASGRWSRARSQRGAR